MLVSVRHLPAALVLLVPLGLGGCGDKSSNKGDATANKGDAKAKPDNKGAKKGDAKAKADGKAPADAGKAAAAWPWDLPKGLTAPPEVPADNPMSKEKVALGHRLFMEKRLSAGDTRSCYSCHQNELGNADGRKLALGAQDKPLTRNTPTIWNVAYHKALYWDGRAPSLEKQAIGALKGGNMGLGDTLAEKIATVGALPEYAEAFKKVFGLKDGAKVEPAHVAQALSAYERTLLCGDTAADKGELDEAAKRGQAVFMGKGACAACHGGPNYSDGIFHNVGIETRAADAEGVDLGRGKKTGKAEDNFKFRTPTLRNVAQTAPYFHDGSAATLEDAVKHMAGGPKDGAKGLDPLFMDRKLTDAEVADVVAFLKALDCPGKLEVIGDQKVAGIGAAG